MEHYLLYFAAICGIIFILSLIQNKKEALMNFLLRAVLGILVIYFANKLCYRYGIMAGDHVLHAGINLSTITISGILGIPGIALIYALLYFL